MITKKGYRKDIRSHMSIIFISPEGGELVNTEMYMLANTIMQVMLTLMISPPSPRGVRLLMAVPARAVPMSECTGTFSPMAIFHATLIFLFKIYFFHYAS